MLGTAGRRPAPGSSMHHGPCDVVSPLFWQRIVINSLAHLGATQTTMHAVRVQAGQQCFYRLVAKINVPRGIPRARVLGPARTAVRSDTAALRLRTRRLSDGPRAHNAWVGRKAAGRAAPLDYMLHYESARHLPCMPVSSRHPYCCMPVSSASILLRICLPLLVEGLLACAHSLQVRSLQRLEPHQVGLLVELLAPIRHA